MAPPTIPGVFLSNGVQQLAPPASILDAVNKQVHDAFAALPPDASGALVAIATRDADGKSTANLALVTRVGEHANVTAWIGKSWGAPVAGGAAVQIHW